MKEIIFRFLKVIYVCMFILILFFGVIFYDLVSRPSGQQINDDLLIKCNNGSSFKISDKKINIDEIDDYLINSQVYSLCDNPKEETKNTISKGSIKTYRNKVTGEMITIDTNTGNIIKEPEKIKNYETEKIYKYYSFSKLQSVSKTLIFVSVSFILLQFLKRLLFFVLFGNSLLDWKFVYNPIGIISFLCLAIGIIGIILLGIQQNNV